jgi:hypothetical protein
LSTNKSAELSTKCSSIQSTFISTEYATN